MNQHYFLFRIPRISLVRHPLIALTFLVCTLVGTQSFADMLISPLRVVLDDDNRSASLTLKNTSDGPRTYRLGWAEQVMTENGGYRKVGPDEVKNPASGMIRIAPRQITVGPGENQTVRLSYRPPADQAPGEYRSHLLLQIIPDVSTPTSSMEVDSGQEGIRMVVHMQMSFTLPVIVRQNVAPPTVKLSNIEVLPGDANHPVRMALTLERSGDSSSYGDIVIEAQRNENSPVMQIGNTTGIAIFTEMDRRIVTVPLRQSNLPSGAWIRVAYVGREEHQGRVWAEQVFQNQ